MNEAASEYLEYIIECLEGVVNHGMKVEGGGHPIFAETELYDLYKLRDLLEETE